MLISVNNLTFFSLNDRKYAVDRSGENLFAVQADNTLTAPLPMHPAYHLVRVEAVRLLSA